MTVSHLFWLAVEYDAAFLSRPHRCCTRLNRDVGCWMSGVGFRISGLHSCCIVISHVINSPRFFPTYGCCAVLNLLVLPLILLKFVDVPQSSFRFLIKAEIPVLYMSDLLAMGKLNPNTPYSKKSQTLDLYADVGSTSCFCICAYNSHPIFIELTPGGFHSQNFARTAGGSCLVWIRSGTTPLMRASSSASLYPGFPIFVRAGFFLNWTDFWRDLLQSFLSQIPLCTAMPQQ